MFFALQLDRGNISQALSDNLLEDLGMSTNDVSLMREGGPSSDYQSQIVGLKWKTAFIGCGQWAPALVKYQLT